MLNVLKFYYHYCHYQLPLYLQQFAFKTRSDLHTYDIRNKNNLDMSKIRTKAAENSLRHVIPKIINDTPKIILYKVLTHSLPSFIFYIKQYYLNLYSYNCNINNCYICLNN